MTAPCTACADAALDPHTGSYQASCDECAARALANGPLFYEAAASDTLTPAYRSALQRVFGEAWKNGHWRVKHWAQQIQNATRKGALKENE